MNEPKLVAHPRIEGLAESATLAINERSQHLAESGREVFKFGLGQSPFPVPERVVQALRSNAHRKDYLPVRGLPLLRETTADWFQRRWGLGFDSNHILVAPGSKELLFLIQMALDGVLILPSPSWVSYAPQTQMAGNRTVWADTREDENWCLTPRALTDVCRELPSGKTRILLLNYPNNPTGTTYQATDLKALAEVARQFGLLVISDEIYAEVDHQGTHTSIARYYPEGTIVTTGLSKWCGAGGWRLGLAAFPKELAELADSISKLASETYTSTSAPIQYAAVVAFQEHPDIEDYLRKSRLVLVCVENYVRTRLLECGVRVAEGTGGFYLFCNFEDHRRELAAHQVFNSEQLAEILLMESGVASLPGTAFGRASDELTIRLSYVDFDGEMALTHAEQMTDSGIFETVCPRIVEAMNRLTSWINTI